MVITYSKGNDQPGKVANPARGQLNRENYFSFPVPSSYVLFCGGCKFSMLNNGWSLLSCSHDIIKSALLVARVELFRGL